MSLSKLNQLSHSSLDTFRQALNKQQKLKQAALVEYIVLHKNLSNKPEQASYLLDKLYPGNEDMKKLHKLAHDTYKSYSAFQYSKGYIEALHHKPNKTDDEDWTSFTAQYFHNALHIRQASLPAMLDTIQVLEHELAKADAETRYGDFVQIIPQLAHYRELRNALEQIRLAFDCLILSKFDIVQVPAVQCLLDSHSNPLLVYWIRLYQLLQKPSLEDLNKLQKELLQPSKKIARHDQLDLYNKVLDIYALMANSIPAYRLPREKAYREAIFNDLFHPDDMMSRLNAYVTALQSNDQHSMAKIKHKLVQRYGLKAPIVVIVQALENYINNNLARSERDMLALDNKQNWSICYRFTLLLILYWQKQDLYQANIKLKAFTRYFKNMKTAKLPDFERSFLHFTECYKIILVPRKEQEPIPFAKLKENIEQYPPAFGDFFKQFDPLK